MANERILDWTPMRAPSGDIAPRLTEISDAILFDDVWRRPGLNQRDRSLITVACLIALYRVNELPFHLSQGARKRRHARRDHRADYASRLLLGLADRQHRHRDCPADSGRDPAGTIEGA